MQYLRQSGRVQLQVRKTVGHEQVEHLEIGQRQDAAPFS